VTTRRFRHGGRRPGHPHFLACVQVGRGCPAQGWGSDEFIRQNADQMMPAIAASLLKR
jgi:hypothetical protein